MGRQAAQLEPLGSNSILTAKGVITMISRRKFFMIGLVIFLAISSKGCSGRIDEVDAVGEIVGVWQSQIIFDSGVQEVGGVTTAIRIEPDGTLLGALTQEKLDQGHTSSYSIWFEDGKMRLQGLSEVCGDVVGTYQAQLLPGGNLRFSLVNDECTIRIRWFEGNQDPAVAFPYTYEFVRQE